MEVKRKDTNKDECICSKCKFNLGDEKKCHVVEGEFDNDHGISNFSPKGEAWCLEILSGIWVVEENVPLLSNVRTSYY